MKKTLLTSILFLLLSPVVKASLPASTMESHRADSLQIEIEAPNPICAGDTLPLSQPATPDTAIFTLWQISPSESFEQIEEYVIGQALDKRHDGWRLRYVVGFPNSAPLYSNIVTIKVNELIIYLSGNSEVCSNAEETYYVTGCESARYIWEIQSPLDTTTVESTQNSFTTRWSEIAGNGKVFVTATDTITTCSDTISMKVNISSSLEHTNTIDAITEEGATYLLIYPTPNNEEYKYQWYKDNQLMEGWTQQYIYDENGLKDGTYKVYVSTAQDASGVLVCGAFSNEYSVNKSLTRPVYSVYPNPSSHLDGGFVITNEGDLDIHVGIYTLDGRLVYSETLLPGSNEIKLSLPCGVYIARFTDGKEINETKKIVIQ